MKWETIRTKSFVDANGRLEVCELPFSISRFYIISDADRERVRGNHAHKNLCQIFFVLSGSLKLKLDDGTSVENFNLKNNGTGIIVKPGVWRELSNFSPNTKCLVLASNYFDRSDYISDYTEFQKWVGEHAQKH